MEQGCWGQLLVCIQEELWSLLLRSPLELSLQLLCAFNSAPLGKKHQESRRMKRGDSSSQLSLITQYKLYIQRKAPAEGQGRARSPASLLVSVSYPQPPPPPRLLWDLQVFPIQPQNDACNLLWVLQ